MNLSDRIFELSKTLAQITKCVIEVGKWVLVIIVILGALEGLGMIKDARRGVQKAVDGAKSEVAR